jgi:hypothetical protein
MSHSDFSIVTTNKWGLTLFPDTNTMSEPDKTSGCIKTGKVCAKQARRLAVPPRQTNGARFSHKLFDVTLFAVPEPVVGQFEFS